MDRATVEARVREIVGDLADGVDLDVAAAASVIPDAAGRLPGAEGYVPTYDEFWMAAEVVDAQLVRGMSRGTVTRWSSEGTTMEVQPADLSALAYNLRTRSRIFALAQALDRLGVIEVPGHQHGTPRSASDWTEGYGRVIGNWS